MFIEVSRTPQRNPLTQGPLFFFLSTSVGPHCHTIVSLYVFLQCTVGTGPPNSTKQKDVCSKEPLGGVVGSRVELRLVIQLQLG